MAEKKSFFTGYIFDVYTDNGDDIVLEKFLEQSAKTIDFIDALGASFYLSKNDIQGNITKIREAMKRLPHNATARTLLEFEQKTKAFKSDKSGTVGLLWLKRGLRYTTAIIENLAVEEREGRDESLKSMAADAYERTLRSHHNAIVVGLMKAAFYALPYRAVLLKTLSGGKPIDAMLVEMDESVFSLRKVLSSLNQSLIDYNQITDLSKDA